ncbi:exopolysaccharide biosynthesis polyprenyl glycosylphosphotransferase [uncultured Maribacter sp.]|uniref:exopolysaccharide biosynthesis polyprenyl glycosylphosphotransferase n=1 Tax=uncultured Maribacter sp. TaxID=431308 RepID=UPI002621816E|nr:exopolysaccharide biosynthesis polyprenyl glycosylphosphotransferase [uncultured Maribacter sp.]
MKKFKKSHLIIPISVILHLCIINGTLLLLTPDTYLPTNNILYYNFSWLLITYGMNYYPTGRKETFMTNVSKMFQLYAVYGLAYLALFTITRTPVGSLWHQFLVYLLICSSLTWYRIIFFWARRNYRMIGGNSLNVVVLGRDPNLKKIRRIFDDPYLGYRYKGYFDNKPSKSPTYLGDMMASYRYILDNDVDEIYCVASNFNTQELKNLVDFADNNLIKFKIILDNKEVFSKAMSIEAYQNIPVLNLRKVPLDTEYARIAKRSFDILFSLIVILGVLSWLTPILYVLIKWESKGPLYFKQKRHGFKRKVFWCYKYRSMTVNKDSDSKMATKNDARVTKIGKFMRKTSIDELPQFINVLKGEMSVVGPRPHMEAHTIDYQTSVDKYLVRHFVKPGITGLAQTKGYRGEIGTKTDILNRTRLDIFYVEKWSLMFDVSIIYATIANVFAGEEKAY